MGEGGRREMLPDHVAGPSATQGALTPSCRVVVALKSGTRRGSRDPIGIGRVQELSSRATGTASRAVQGRGV